MTQYWSDEARLLMNAPYFSKLHAPQIHKLTEIHLNGTECELWGDLVLALYAAGKLKDVERPTHLINVLLPLKTMSWDTIKEYARLSDPPVYEAMEEDPRVKAAIDANHRLLHFERNHGQPRAPPPPHVLALNEPYFGAPHPSTQ